MPQSLRDAASEVDQHRARFHQHGSCPNHEQVGLLGRAAQLDGVQQRGIYASQTCQLPRVVMVGAMAAPGHRFQIARVGDDGFVAHLFDQLSHPR